MLWGMCEGQRECVGVSSFLPMCGSMIPWVLRLGRKQAFTFRILAPTHVSSFLRPSNFLKERNTHNTFSLQRIFTYKKRKIRLINTMVLTVAQALSVFMHANFFSFLKAQYKVGMVIIPILQIIKLKSWEFLLSCLRSYC